MNFDTFMSNMFIQEKPDIISLSLYQKYNKLIDTAMDCDDGLFEQE